MKKEITTPIIPSIWYPVKYSTHAATKTPAVDKRSDSESAPYALNESDRNFSPALLYHHARKSLPMIPNINMPAVINVKKVSSGYKI